MEKFPAQILKSIYDTIGAAICYVKETHLSP